MRAKSDVMPPPSGEESPYGAVERARLDTPTILRRAEETQQSLAATAKVVRDVLLPFHGERVDLDVIDEMAKVVVAALRERGLL